MSFNQCTFVGNLGRDPEMKFLPNGNAICNFSLGVSEKWKTKDGDQKEHTEWVRCTVYGKLAEVCGKYLTKGKQALVQGRMQTRKWTDKEGNDRYTTEIIVDTMKMLGGRPDGSRENSGGWDDAKREAQRPQQKQDESFDEDIPF